jgi:hypothetical protein
MGQPGHNERNSLPFTSDGLILLESAARGTDGTEEIGGVGAFNAATFVLESTAATAAGDASDTLEVFIQRELPNGDWDDIVSFTVVDADDAFPLVMIADVFPGADGDNYAATASDGALAAGTVRNVPWYGSLRIKWDVTADGGEEFTFAVYGMFRQM